MSDNLDEAKIFYLDVEGQRPVRMEIQFGDFHRYNVAYHCGTAVTVTGSVADREGELVIRKITDLRSLFGKQAEGAPG